jgi:hypothetical protein
LSGEDVAESLRKEIEEIQPEMITNMVINPRDKNAGRIIQLAAEKYLMVHCTDLGGVDYDRYVYAPTNGVWKLLPGLTSRAMRLPVPTRLQ